MHHIARAACLALIPFAAFAQVAPRHSPAPAPAPGTLAAPTAGPESAAAAVGRHALATRHVHQQAIRSGARRLLAELPGEQEIQLSLLLSLRDAAGLERTLADLYDPDSPNYRQFLSTAEFTARFGPSPSNYETLLEHLRAKGLTVTETSPNRLVVDVSGKVRDVEQAFHVKLGRYQHPTESRSYFGPDREPSLDVATPVWRVAGLDDFSIPRPMLANARLQPASVLASGPGGTVTGADIRTAYYGGSALTGAGQSVALFQFGPYWTGDLQNYFNNTGMKNTVPVNNILLNGTAMCASACDDGEQVIDIAQAIGVAPGLSQVRVYIGHSDVDIFNRMATDNISKTISISWGWGPADPGSDDPIFLQLAAQGQSVFAASGDSGSYTSGAFYPADDPNLTAVGGTVLSTNSSGAWAGETTWGGSGGGYVGSQAIPSWQVSAINSSNKGSKTLRNVPDVGGEAGNSNYLCGNGSCGGNVGGTSFASPQWAGFIALVNQQAASAGQPPVGFLNPKIYALGAGASYAGTMHDVTTGNNGGFQAVAGYDLATGWGSPNVQALADYLVGNGGGGIKSGKTYKLINTNSDKALDVLGGSAHNGAATDINDQNDDASQRWKVQGNDDGTYTLINKHSKKALDVTGAGTGDGVVVEIYEQNGSAAQKWTFSDNGDGSYTVVNPNSNKALDVYSSATANGSKIDIWDINHTGAQKWKLVQVKK